MQPIHIEIPEDIASHIKLPPKRAKRMIMEELVIRLYEQEIISSAQGARLLNMDRLAFERFLAEHEVAIYNDADELVADVESLKKAL